MSGTSRVIAWATADQEPLLRAVVEQARLELIAVSSPRASDAAALRHAFDVEQVQDIRQAAQHPDVDVLWLAARDVIDAEERALLRDVSATVLSCEPRPDRLADIVMEPREAATSRFLPLMRLGDGFGRAADALEELGPPRCLSILSLAPANTGSLFARLFDAMDVVEALCLPVLGIDAALSAPSGPAPEVLSDLRGHMTLNLRFADECCGSITVSDGAGTWHRRVTLIGEDATLRIDDAGYAFSRDADEPRGAMPVDPATLIASQIRRHLDRRDSVDGPAPRTARLLALCEAARLSCRTGQVETPHRLLEMLGHP